MRTKALRASLVLTPIVGALALHADPARAQHRHRRHHTTGTAPAAGTGAEQPASAGTPASEPTPAASPSPASGDASHAGDDDDRAPGAATPASSGTTGARGGAGRTGGAGHGSTGASAPASEGSGSGASGASTEGSGSSAGASHASASPAPPPSVLISNGLRRPGFHATRAAFDLFASVSPAAWAWPWGGFIVSGGLRLGVPLTSNGPIANLNNDLRLFVGAQFIYSVTPKSYYWISAPVTLQWNFYLSNQWSVLLEAGLLVDVFTYDDLNCYDHPRYYCDRVLFHPAGAFGLRRHLSSRAGDPPGYPAIEFRFTYPGGLQVGLNF